MKTSPFFQEMAQALGMLPGHLEKLIRTAPLRYKKFTIPKRDGSPRIVAQPAREVKILQRWIVHELKECLPVHSAATAYAKGSSIINNASPHIESNYFLKIDFQKFFPSIKGGDIDLHLQSINGRQLSKEDRDVIVRVCTWAPNRVPPLELCIGAPSSPLLSNSMLYEFDCAVANYFASASLEIKYTRYADDLTFSSIDSETLGGLVDQVVRIAGQLRYPRLRLNARKTVYGSRAGRRVVTGLVLTPDKKLSVGRDRKRLVRAMYHRFLNGELNDLEIMQMKGLLSFVDSVEPGFKERLEEHYRSKRIGD